MLLCAREGVDFWRGDGILLPDVTTISPPHQLAALTASPRGEAYAITLCWGYYYGIFLHKPHRLCQRLPLGVQLSGGQLDIQSKNSFALKVGRPKAGSDEGEPGGFHGVGNSPPKPAAATP